MSLSDLFRRPAQSGSLIPVLGMLAALLLAVLAFPRVETYFADRARQDGQATLRLVSETVAQSLHRYEPLPELIAERRTIHYILGEPGNAGLIPFVNESLRQTALSVGASDIYLMDTTGKTIAASNYREEHSFMGRNFAFRPYFQEALGGRSSRFHALGTTSGSRGLYFAAPVLDGIDVIGVLALKVTVEDLENNWTQLGREVLIADENSVIFMASRPDWRFRTLAPISDATRAEIAATRQFPPELVRPLDDLAARDGFLLQTREIGEGRWSALVLTPTSAIRARAFYALALWGLGVLVLALAVFAFLQRRARVLERQRIQNAERAVLESRVRERTADLARANADLKVEIEDRRAAEARLRTTQKELVQAGKLAALGQMSAALSHEINQPLAAVKSYAQNAATYLDRGRLNDARENVVRISDMADRMARISAHLRNFAFRPGDRLGAVPVGRVIAEAVALVEPKLRRVDADLRFDAPDPEIWARGGPLRLQQVIVNMLSNALDAMAGDIRPVIEISVREENGTVLISVRDHGPGLSEAAIEQAFEPFFTTKEAGVGMGLGLSISFNIVEDFGGRLTARNHEAGGAVFTVALQQAAPETLVAE